MNKQNNTIKQLNWRYATKLFDQSKKLSPEKLEIIKESLRLSPSSYGLQGWKFLHITNPETRLLLKEAAYGQGQITDSSDLFVLCITNDFSSKNIDQFIKLTADTRGIKPEDLAGFKDLLTGVLSSKTTDQIAEWLKKQVYIALGQTIAAAAIEEIDTCPMEGFDSKRFDQILNLEDKKLSSVVVLAVGYRSSDDKYSQLPKVRFSSDEVFVEYS